jgi:hypothetical protein
MKRRLKWFLMIVIWAIALALSAHARAEDDAMGLLGIAVAIMGDLRSAPDAAQLARGAAAIARAQAIGGKTGRECALIEVVAQFYHRHEERTHDMRLVYYERALSRARTMHPDDLDIASLYAHAWHVAFSRARERVEAAYAREAGR